jgi:hypothetical protein
MVLDLRGFKGLPAHAGAEDRGCADSVETTAATLGL